MSSTFLALLPLALAQSYPDPWHGWDTPQVQVVSRGERFELEDARAQAGFTIVDFGASWCNPCHQATAQLKPYLTANADVNVAVVALDQAPWELRETPVVEQHMRWVRSIPYFIVLDPEGHRIYRGHSVDRVMRRIDRRRS